MRDNENMGEIWERWERGWRIVRGDRMSEETKRESQNRQSQKSLFPPWIPVCKAANKPQKSFSLSRARATSKSCRNRKTRSCREERNCVPRLGRRRHLSRRTQTFFYLSPLSHSPYPSLFLSHSSSSFFLLYLSTLPASSPVYSDMPASVCLSLSLFLASDSLALSLGHFGDLSLTASRNLDVGARRRRLAGCLLLEDMHWSDSQTCARQDQTTERVRKERGGGGERREKKKELYSNREAIDS